MEIPVGVKGEDAGKAADPGRPLPWMPTGLLARAV